MRHVFRVCAFAAAATVLAAGAGAAAPPAAVPAPNFLRDWAETFFYTLGRPVNVRITPSGKSVLYLESGARDKTRRLYAYDIATATAHELVTPEQLLKGAEEKLSPAEKARRERMRLVAKGFASFELSKDGSLVILPLSGKLYGMELAAGNKVRTLYGADEPAIDPQLSPDGKLLAYVKGYDLWVTDVATGKSRALTKGGTEAVSHGTAEFMAQEEMGRFHGFWWSPDSRSIAYQETDNRGVERFAITDPGKPESGAESFYYPRPGKANAKIRLGVIAVVATPAKSGGAKGKKGKGNTKAVAKAGATAGDPGTTWVRWDKVRYPYLARVEWREKKAPLSILVQSRDQREVAWMEVEAQTGATHTLHVETDAAWVELDGTPRWLPDGKGFVMTTERSGRRELMLYRADGQADHTVIPASCGFLDVAEVVEATGDIYAECSPDPREVQIVRTSASATQPDVLQKGPGERSVVVADSGAAYVIGSSSIDTMNVQEVFKAGGDRVGALPAVTESPAFRPDPMFTSVMSQGRTYYASVVRPQKYKPGKKLPVIVSVYGGPTTTVVVASQRTYLFQQWLADHGFVVVGIDNRGTPRRDREWSRSIKNSFGAIPLDDQVAALTQLGTQIPEMDLNRVGIYGWSFGGYMSALAVLKRPDVFKAAVAGAPVVDWRDYDTHYTERYLGTPEDNAKGYDESSLLTYAPQLSRPLLIIHGTSDDNVYFFHTLKLTDALFKAGRPFELLPLLSFTHMVPDPLVEERLYGRIVDFLSAQLHP